MGGEQACSKPQLQNWLFDLGFYHLASETTGCTYHRIADDTCLVIDTAFVLFPIIPMFPPSDSDRPPEIPITAFQTEFPGRRRFQGFPLVHEWNAGS
jgi:hypothetical protein